MNNLSESRSTPSGTTAQNLVGNWGGVGIYLSADQNGASLDFDCATGEIKSPIQVDSNGNFNVAGSYFSSQGVTQIDDVRSSTGVPVHYVGTVNGVLMSLRIIFDQYTTSAASNEGIVTTPTLTVLDEPPFSLVLGSNPKLHRCYVPASPI